MHFKSLTLRLKLNHNDRHPRSKALLKPLWKSQPMQWPSSVRRACAPFVWELPFPIDDAECNILVWGTSTEMKEHSLIISRLLHNFVSRGFGLVDEIRIEDIELIPLDHFRRWVIDTVDNVNGRYARTIHPHTHNGSGCIYSTRTQYELGWNNGVSEVDTCLPSCSWLCV